MGARTEIPWTDSTWSPVTGCSKVSDGCSHCYGEAMARRFDKEWKPWTKANAAHNVRLHPDRLEIPLHWRKPRRVFVCSTGDPFHKLVPWEFIERVFAVMGSARQHTFQVLTKRPRKMHDYFSHPGTRERTRKFAKLMGAKVQTDPFWISADLWSWPPPNVWLGVSVENQKAADERIPLLLQTPAAMRFISIEPMLGPSILNGVGRPWLTTEIDHPNDTKLDWVIVGGESGPGARPLHPDWVRSIRDQCQFASVPFFFKGWGEWAPIRGEDHKRVGKKRAGRLLDGREWSECPQ